MEISKTISDLVRSIQSKEALPSKVQIIAGSEGAHQSILLSALSRWKKIILVLPTHRETNQFLHFLELNRYLLGSTKISLLPHLSLWGSDRFINPSLSRAQRLDALINLLDSSSPQIVVTTMAGLTQSTLSPTEALKTLQTVKKHDTLDQDHLIKTLASLGYRHSSIVDEEGLYSTRGALIDIYPPNQTSPVRIEFSGEHIEGIRSFNIEDQKSKEHLDEVLIGPAHEVIYQDFERKNAAQRLHEYLHSLPKASPHDCNGMRGAFLTNDRPAGWDMMGPIVRPTSEWGFEFIPGESCLLFPKGVPATEQAYRELYKQFCTSHELDESAGKVSVPPHMHFPSMEVFSNIENRSLQILEMENPHEKSNYERWLLASKIQNFQGVSSQTSGASRYDSWAQAIQNLLLIDRGRVLVFASNTEQKERIESLFSHRDFKIGTKFSNITAMFSTPPDERIYVIEGYIHQWTWVEETKTLLIPEHEIFGITQKKTRSAKSRLKNYLSSFRDLSVGDLIVHDEHGIGRYRGMVTLALSGITADFLFLEYAGSDKIYLPIDKLNHLQKYSASSDEQKNPPLDKLGGGSWEKRKSKVKAAVREMADKLIKLQAQRALAHIHQYAPPNDDYFKFEAEFPYDETEDQRKAIEDVNGDLQGDKAMDRLICGDVGFGKTEVALRAAFRVAYEGLQTLVLVPTTILCYQHFRTFSDRLSRHGLKVGQINRFVPASEQRKIIADFASGSIDVLVGTHRLLSQDIVARRLGLIIVDEEQRFGVEHKEKLKELRAGADILTLTATPIPRTLHMSMLGLRDISIITTPPNHRLSVKTYIAKMDETLIRDALSHELARGGQAFYLHNRVEDIEATCLWIKSLIPKAQVRFAHGQMRETELENAIIDFIEHKFDVLVCTTIIESGIDMPNVNTLIVSNADRFGLAQLYQMRGRVGRSSLQAYAYFLTKEPDLLTDESRRRLEVLAAHQELGSGFQIASHDLEIRGAGNLLGGEQSGHAAEVGLEMYTNLLSEAIAEIKGQTPEPSRIDAEIKLPITAMIPDTYVQEERLRLQFYKQFLMAETLTEIKNILSELKDRFGLYPELVERLAWVSKIRILLIQMGANFLTMNGKANLFEIRFKALKESQIDHLVLEVHRKPELYRLSPDYRLYLTWDKIKHGKALDQADHSIILKQLFELVSPLVIGIELP